jgi:hypothetical protein
MCRRRTSFAAATDRDRLHFDVAKAVDTTVEKLNAEEVAMCVGLDLG